MPDLDRATTSVRAAYDALAPDPRSSVTLEDTLKPIRERLVGLLDDLQNLRAREW